MIKAQRSRRESPGSMGARNVLAASVIAALAGPFGAGTLAASEPAPDAAAERQSTRIEEIVVTATRRREEARKIPLSIRVFSSEDLAAKGATDLEDVLPATPSVDYAAILPGLTSLNFRGISAPIGESTVGVYIDEMPVTADLGGQPDIKTFDLERIEVLRGPQGTLYGEGSMGGTLRIITNKPDSTNFGANVEVGAKTTRYGKESYDVKGMVNLPLIRDRLALRAVGFYIDQAGYIDNTQLSEADVNSEKSMGGRIALKYTPNDKFTANATVLYQSTDVGGTNVSDENYRQESSVAEPRDDEYTLANLTLTYDFPAVQLLSATSYWDRPTTRVVATRGTEAFVPIIQSLILGQTGLASGPITAIYSDLDVGYEIFTQELRLVSQGESRLRWTLGGFYKDSKRDTFQSSVADGPNKPLLPYPLILGVTDVSFEQKALYGEVSYRLTDRLTATVGARWFDEVQKRVGNQTGAFASAAAAVNGEVSISGITPKAALAFELNDEVMLYANAAQGFRAGGVNETLVVGLGAPPTFEEDSLWQYELGAKTLWLDGRLALSGSVYRIVWSDFQTTGVPISIFTYTINGGEAQSDGFELELQARPLRGLEFSAGYSYTDARLTDDTATAPAGTPLPFVAKNKYSAAVQYRFPLRAGLYGLTRFEYRASDGREGTISNAPTQAARDARRFLYNPSYSLGDARIGVEAENWQLYAFVNNIWNERISYFHVFSAPNSPSFVNEPRSVGLTFRRQF